MLIDKRSSAKRLEFRIVFLLALYNNSEFLLPSGVVQPLYIINTCSWSLHVGSTLKTNAVNALKHFSNLVLLIIII